ncbi:DUF2510 domain-containing protein [Nocardioides marmorisolisilvae]|nr:DUF2510 domain-containing protein [Nocardioides marmorisolisilvae]
MTSAPPGWYPAEDGNLRYWDGAAWTEHTQAVPPAAAPAFAPPMYSPYAPTGAYGLPRPERDGFGIASLVLSIPGVLILSIPFGIIGLVRFKQRTRRGPVPAILGLAFSALWIGAVVILIVVGVGHDVTRDATGAVTQSGKISPADLHEGDCVVLPRVVDGTFQNVELVPCDQPHNGQVFTILNAPAGPYPGGTALRESSLDACRTALQEWLGTDQTLLHVVSFFPTELRWRLDDRRERCLAVDRDRDVTGDMRKYK